MIRAALLTTGLVVAAVAASPVFAQSTMRPAAVAKPAWYVGGGLGYAKLGESIADTSLPVTGATASSFSSRGSDTAFKAFVGMNALPWLGVELAYLNFGNFDVRRDVTAPGTRTVDGRWKLQGFSLGLKPTWQATESFGLFAKVGAARMQTHFDFTDSASAANSGTEKSNRVSLFYGLGAEYDITRNFGLRAEWELYKHATNTNMMTIGNGAIDYKTFFASAQLRF